MEAAFLFIGDDQWQEECEPARSSDGRSTWPLVFHVVSGTSEMASSSMIVRIKARASIRNGKASGKPGTAQPKRNLRRFCDPNRRTLR